MLKPDLVHRIITKQVQRWNLKRGMDIYGIHGIPHWGRVRSFGLSLAKEVGLPEKLHGLVELFALYHDIGRRSDGRDFEHGPESSKLFWKDALDPAMGLFGDKPDEPFAEQCRQTIGVAIELHNTGRMDAADLPYLSSPIPEARLVTEICWDADRLDLGRAGVQAEYIRVILPQAKDFVQSCYAISTYRGWIDDYARLWLNTASRLRNDEPDDTKSEYWKRAEKP